MVDKAAVITAASRLDPLPASAMCLTGLASSDDVSLSELAEVVQFDPVLATRVLREANSAAFAASAPIATLDAAIQRMGIGRVVALSVGLGVRKQLKKNSSRHGVVETSLWRHAVATSVAAECLSTQTAISIPPESITAALLHDIGKQLLVRIVDDATFIRLQRIWTMPGADRIQAERELLGCDHAELGELIAQKWRLPDEIRLPIRHHHDPVQFENRSVDAVYVANVVAHAIGEALSKGPADPELLDAVLRRLEVSQAGLSRLGVLTHQKLEQVLSRYN